VSKWTEEHYSGGLDKWLTKWTVCFRFCWWNK
jgi:hypothetical protein